MADVQVVTSCLDDIVALDILSHLYVRFSSSGLSLAMMYMGLLRL